MNEIEILKKLKADNQSRNLNESDTRFQIIDTILVEVLKWPKETITTEKYVNGNRADYVFKNKNDKPILILESKKNDIYFELPKTLNQGKNFEKIQIEKLITDEEIKKAVYQVKEYAEDLFCNFAIACNGKCWIIFRIFCRVRCFSPDTKTD